MSPAEGSPADVPAAGHVLAIDTATAIVSVALAPFPHDPARPPREDAVGGTDDPASGHPVTVAVATRRHHAEVLVPTIRDLLRDTGIPMPEVAAIVAGVGPGLFTGLRVGVTTAKTMAWALGIPVVGVSSLEAVAAAVPGEHVVAVLDARRDEVYWAEFARGARRGAERVDPPHVVADALEPPVVIAGDGAHRYATELVRPGVQRAEISAPDPAALWRLGVAALARGEGIDPAGLAPNYLRRTDAEIAWDRRLVETEDRP